MFIFFSAAARTWIISSHPFLNADRLHFTGLCRLSVSAGTFKTDSICFLFCFDNSPASRFSFALKFFRSLGKEFETERNNFISNLIEQFNKKIKRFALVFQQRVFLTVCAQTDSFFEVIHFAEMFFPSVINNRKNGI